MSGWAADHAGRPRWHEPGARRGTGCRDWQPWPASGGYWGVVPPGRYSGGSPRSRGRGGRGRPVTGRGRALCQARVAVRREGGSCLRDGPSANCARPVRSARPATCANSACANSACAHSACAHSAGAAKFTSYAGRLPEQRPRAADGGQRKEPLVQDRRSQRDRRRKRRQSCPVAWSAPGRLPRRAGPRRAGLRGSGPGRARPRRARLGPVAGARPAHGPLLLEPVYEPGSRGY